MVLENHFEVFADLGSRIASKLICHPGDFITLAFGQSGRSQPLKLQLPNSFFQIVAGARSLYMTPPIGIQSKLDRIVSEEEILLTAPKCAYQHGEFFESLVDALPKAKEWRASIIYFPQSLIDKISTDNNYAPVYRYLHHKFVDRNLFDNSTAYFDLTFSTLLEEFELPVNPQIVDLMRHTIGVVLGEIPGFIPMTHEKNGPIRAFSDFYVDIYRLDCIPTFMGPAYYSFLTDDHPIYVSVSVPSSTMLSQNRQKNVNKLELMRLIARYFKAFLDAFRDPDGEFKGTIFEIIANELVFDFIHETRDHQKLILLPHVLEKADPRFLQSMAINQAPNSEFHQGGEFFRGCIRIQRKDSKLRKREAEF